ncbi:MAG: PEP-CTERM sorting domain-containing protein, partial [Myxococcota bacterium]
YVENAFGTTSATGAGIYVASMVFHVVAAIGSETLTLAFTSSNLIQTGTVVTAVSAIGVGGPITLTGAVPEPTTAMLIGIGVIGLGLAGRRRA